MFIYLAVLVLSCSMSDLVPQSGTKPGPPALVAFGPLEKRQDMCILNFDSYHTITFQNGCGNLHSSPPPLYPAIYGRVHFLASSLILTVFNFCQTDELKKWYYLSLHFPNHLWSWIYPHFWKFISLNCLFMFFTIFFH